MSLFQKSVEKKYLNELDSVTIENKYNRFLEYFGNPVIQENIRNSKEEQFQEGFFNELFVKILDYTLNPNPHFNLTTEFKNIDDSKKADGAILSGEDAVAIIELKSTDLNDLDKVEAQAFGYKHHQPKCIYVITSNFEKLRFYIENAVDYIEFDLFNLTSDQFVLMWLCLSKDSVLNNVPLTLKKSSVLQEENITKKLYADYSKFREQIFGNIVRNNPDFDELLLFNKTQKLLDRFLFIFFAEDRLLLPPNSISEIVKQWTTLKDEYDEYKPLYDRFKKYFVYMNTGYKGKKYDIFPYNGGLFLPDEILENIKIDDDILYEHTLKLSAYDFETDVDVNILGHIFEHSLSEIESVQASLRGEAIDKQKTKRKKDGIFYTPKYITKYIVENTVGRLCIEKRQELSIVDEEFNKGRKNRKKETIKALDEKLNSYREWLLSLTILDPACGSGAFLNQALDFLIQENGKIDKLRAQLLGGAIVFSDITTEILENNIYGVDLNQESVEIAKLSLWLRTAQKGRKLNTLSNNIKCGNTLIDDPNVAGEKSFNWHEEYRAIFDRGGFDVVIGNPPYVRKQGLIEHYPEMTIFYEKAFVSATGNYDIYALFMEHSYSLINEKGIVSFILPHKFLVSDFGVGIRKFLKENKAVETLIHFGSYLVFQEASTYTCIVDLTKRTKNIVRFRKIHPTKLFHYSPFDTMDYNVLSDQNWDLQSEKVHSLIDKLKKQPFTVSDVFDRIFVGIQTGLDSLLIFPGEESGNIVKVENGTGSFEIERDFVKRIIKGNEVSRYKHLDNKYFVLFPYSISSGKSIPLSFEEIETSYPLGARYLLSIEDVLRKREKGKFDNDKEWFLFTRNQGMMDVENPKIMTQEISRGCNLTYDSNGSFYHVTTVYSFVKNSDFKVDEKYYLGILNSKIMWFFLKNTGTELGGGYFRFKTNYIKPFPLPYISENSDSIINRVNSQLAVNKKLQMILSKFEKYLRSQFYIEKLSKKLQNWHELEFGDFIKELNEAIKVAGGEKLSKTNEMEWMDVFETKKAEAKILKIEIDKTDNELDQMVYELYELSKEDIKIVEESIII